MSVTLSRREWFAGAAGVAQAARPGGTLVDSHVHLRVYIKYSAINYSSKQPYPYSDAKPLVRRAYDAFGADRMIWAVSE